MSAKISVIIPVYNVEEYIKECLDSVVNQTFSNLEIICIDDCGTDNSINIVQEYALKDKRIKIIKQECNKGVGPARNRGILESTGDYIIFLDSDDYLELDALEKLYDKIIATNADFVTVNYDDYYDEFSEKLCKSNIPLQVTRKNFNKVLNNLLIVAWGKLFSANYIKKNKLFFINSHDIHEDDGFTLKILSTYPTYSCIPDLGVFYRKNPSSIMSTRTKERSKIGKTNNINDAIKYIEDNCSDSRFIIKQIKHSYRYSRFFYFWGKLFRFLWEKYDKHIVVFYIEIFKSKVVNNISVNKLLGIKISSKNYNKMNIQKVKL